MHRLQIAPLSLLLLSACVPGDGTIKIVGDASLGIDGVTITPGQEFRISTPDYGVTQADSGGAAQTDSGGGPLADAGNVPPPDTTPPPKSDTAPAPCPPQGPFGSSKGITASSFSDIPDCGGTKYSLHAQCGKFKGIVIAMMSPS